MSSSEFGLLIGRLPLPIAGPWRWFQIKRGCLCRVLMVRYPGVVLLRLNLNAPWDVNKKKVKPSYYLCFVALTGLTIDKGTATGAG